MILILSLIKIELTLMWAKIGDNWLQIVLNQISLLKHLLSPRGNRVWARVGVITHNLMRITVFIVLNNQNKHLVSIKHLKTIIGNCFNSSVNERQNK